MNPILINMITLVAGATFTWILGRSKSKIETDKMHAEIERDMAETEKIDIDNFRAVVNMWKEACFDLQAQIKKLTSEVGELRSENISLKDELKRVEQLLIQKQ